MHLKARTIACLDIHVYAQAQSAMPMLDKFIYEKYIAMGPNKCCTYVVDWDTTGSYDSMCHD